MDDALLVGLLQRRGYLDGNFQHVMQIHSPATE